MPAPVPPLGYIPKNGEMYTPAGWAVRFLGKPRGGRVGPAVQQGCDDRPKNARLSRRVPFLENRWLMNGGYQAFLKIKIEFKKLV